MPFLSFPEYRPDVDDYLGAHTQVMSGVLPRGDGWGPMPALEAYSAPLTNGNDGFTKVLLHFDGPDASTAIADSNVGGAAHVWTAGGHAQIDTAQSRLGGGSLLLDGTGDYVTTPDHPDFTLGSGDWTIDCWFRVADAGGAFIRLAGQSDSGPSVASSSFWIQRSSGNVMLASVLVGGSTFNVTGTLQYTNATNPGWHHFALVHIGNTLRMFIDGAQQGGDVAIAGTVNNSTNALSVGRLGESVGSEWNGWIDEFRISIGIARWTANFTPPRSPYDTAQNGICRGFTYARAADGTIAVFAATATRLLRFDNTSLMWEDVSNNGLAYSPVPSTDQWQFAQFGSVVIAVQANVGPQAFAIGSATTFVDLGGGPPSARYVAVIGRFLVLSGLVNSPTRVHWSDLDNITTWAAGTGFANSVDLPDGGVVRGVAGGEFGVILQESAARRMTYVTGQKPAFQIERIAEELGLLGPYSIARTGGRVLFVSPQGFQEYTTATGLVPIGKERIDRTFLADLDIANLHLLIGAADPAGTRVFWVYKSVAGTSSTAFDKVICYDVALQRFSPPIAVGGEYLAPLVKPGQTLDELNTVSGSLDALGFTLDSVPSALSARLAAFDSVHRLALFGGANLEAVLETPEQGLPGSRMLVRGFAVRTDAAGGQGSVRHRAGAQAALVQTSEAAIDAQGFCPQRIDTRLARARVRIPAGTLWTYCMGIEPDFVPTGER